MRCQPDCHHQYMATGTRSSQARLSDWTLRAVDMDLYIHRCPAVPAHCDRCHSIWNLCEKTR